MGQCVREMYVYYVKYNYAVKYLYIHTTYIYVPFSLSWSLQTKSFMKLVILLSWRLKKGLIFQQVTGYMWETILTIMIVKFGISIFDIFTKRKDNCRSGYYKQLLVDNEFKPDYVEIYYFCSQKLNFKAPGLFWMYFFLWLVYFSCCML